MRLYFSIVTGTASVKPIKGADPVKFSVINSQTREVVAEGLSFDDARILTIDKTNEVLRLARMLGEVAA